MLQTELTEKTLYVLPHATDWGDLIDRSPTVPYCMSANECCKANWADSFQLPHRQRCVALVRYCVWDNKCWKENWLSTLNWTVSSSCHTGDEASPRCTIACQIFITKAAKRTKLRFSPLRIMKFVLIQWLSTAFHCLHDTEIKVAAPEEWQDG